MVYVCRENGVSYILIVEKPNILMKDEMKTDVTNETLSSAVICDKTKQDFFSS